MGTLTIRNIDDMTKSKLRIRAAKNGRSMEEELRKLVQAFVNADDAGQTAEDFDWADRISTAFRAIGGFEISRPVHTSRSHAVDFSGPEYGED